MKKIIILLAFSLLCTFVQAQTYSEWIKDVAHPTMQVRWATKKDAHNYSYLQVEIKSSVGCKFNLTATVCNADAKDKNGWKAVLLVKDKPALYSFKIMNSCSNGFWF